MFLNRFLLPAAMLALSPVLLGTSVYVSDFSGANVGDPLNGVDGWFQGAPSSDPINSPLSWVSMLDGDKSASIGAYYDVPAFGSSYDVARVIGVPAAGSSLVLKFSLQDSTTMFPERNEFSIGVLDASGNNLLTLGFTPTSQSGIYDDPSDPTDPATSDALWNVTSSSDSMGVQPAFAAVGEDSVYILTIDFTAAGGDMDYNVNLVSTTNIFNNAGTLGGAASDEFNVLQVSTSIGSGASDWGDNFLSFEGIPEPSTLMLLGLSAFGLLRRRR